MTDRELLEMAAKAAGRVVEGFSTAKGLLLAQGDGVSAWWNPLTNDGDALRLAVKLEIAITIGHWEKKSVSAERTTFHQEFGYVWPKSVRTYELLGEDAGVATRRAIVRTAAEIGKAMP